MEDALGAKIHITYKTGGAGAVGWQQAYIAKPDGYTLTNVVTPDIMLLPHTGKVGYKPLDFEYITWTETSPNGWAVPKDSKYASLKDFISAAKANPGKLTVGGVGKTGKLYFNAMADAMGIKCTYVPFAGGLGDIVPALEGDHVDAAVFGVASLKQRKAVRVLGISGTDPDPAFPDAPTFDSLGYEGVVLGTSWGIAAPPGTPKPIVKKVNRAADKAMKDHKVISALHKYGLVPLHKSPKQSDKFARQVHDKVALAYKK